MSSTRLWMEQVAFAQCSTLHIFVASSFHLVYITQFA